MTDLANAIARAEEVIRARSSRVLTTGPDSSAQHEPGVEDIFDKLVAANKPMTKKPDAVTTSAPVATDDAVGPAIHAPSRPTPLPPRTSSIPLPPGVLRPATLLRAPQEVFATPIPTTPAPPHAPAPAVMSAPPPAPAVVPTPAPSSSRVNATQPLPAMNIPPAARTAPILVLDEDAFYHPAGRIRTLADVTLETYRPEPTLMVRLRERRHALKWVVASVVVSLALFAIFAVAVGFGRRAAEHTPPPTAKPVATTTAAAATAAAKPVATTTAAAPSAPAPDVPVFDVNSLKSAPPTKPRR